MLQLKQKTLLLATAFILILGLAGILQPVRSFMYWLLTPVMTVTRDFGLGISGSIQTVGNIRDLHQENIELKERTAILEAENAKLKTNLTDYHQISEALGLRTNLSPNMIAARVIGTDSGNRRNAYLIDKGVRHGLIEGQAVTDAHGAYIGRIGRVYNNISEIILVTDPNTRLPAEVSENGSRGIVTGEYGLTTIIKEIPQDQPLLPGSQIVTSGFTEGIPAGILIGHIQRIRTGDNEVFQEAVLDLASNLRNLRLVFIVSGNTQND